MFAKTHKAMLRAGLLEEAPPLTFNRPAGSVFATFCNIWPPDFGRAVIDCDRGWFRWINSAPGAPRFDGSDGAARAWDGRLWVLEQSYGFDSWLSHYAADGEPLAHEELPEFADVHDLCETDDGLALADTGKDRVALLPSDGGAPRTLWQASSELADTHHVNAITTLGGRLYATAFGPKPAAGWRHAHDGYIVDCADDRIVVSGIAHPHSLVSAGRSLWWCESATATIWRWSPSADQPPRRYAKLRGYLRGLAVTPSHVYAAASARRTTSRHLGVTIPVPDDSLHVDAAELFVIDRLTKAVSLVGLGHIGAEVFALLPAWRELPKATKETTFAGWAQRISAAAAIAAPVAPVQGGDNPEPALIQ